MNPDQVIDQLNGLLTLCRDSESAFLTAADAVKNSELESLFGELARERAGCAKELRAEIERLGGSAAGSGSIMGAAHRGWIDLKAALTGGDAGAIVAACETSDDSAAAAYERVVDSILPGTSRSLVEKQWNKVKQAHQRLIKLKEQISAGARFQTNE